MSIPLDLLSLLGGQALCITVYGGAGLHKTHSIHTLPPPVCMHDLENGSMSVFPWIRAYRHYTDQKWTLVTQEERESVYARAYASEKPGELIPVSERVTNIPPQGLVDVIKYDPLDVNSYPALVVNVSNFDTQAYNSTAVDSLQELAAMVQAFTKGAGKEMEPMSGMQWGGAQERAALMLRKLDALRSRGVFVYFTSSENIDKDYVTDPRNQQNGRSPEAPYSVKGTVNLPGKLVPSLQHVTDVLLHARVQAGKTVWVSCKEPISPGSGAWWEAKDRTGRIKNPWMPPNVRLMLDQMVGQELRMKIYAARKEVTV